MVSNGTMKQHTCCFDLNYNNTDAARLGLLHYSLDAMRPTWSDLLLDFFGAVDRQGKSGAKSPWNEGKRRVLRGQGRRGRPAVNPERWFIFGRQMLVLPLKLQ